MKNKKITTLSEQNGKQKIPYSLIKMKNKNNTCRNKMNNKTQKILYCWNKIKNKNTTLSEQNEQQKQKILFCKNKMKTKKYYTVGTK
jgi:hypothetical protein